MNDLKARLQVSGPYVIGREVKRAIQKVLADGADPTNRVMTLTPERPAGRSALLCYRLEPFLLRPEQQPSGHIQYWVTAQMARTLLDLGYEVDVASQSNRGYWPRKPYALVIDVRHVLERIAPMLDAGCVKIVHLDTAHLVFHNAAEARRLLALQHRRGVTIPPSRFLTPNLGLEHADCGTMSGNDFTFGTFEYAGKPIYRVPIPSPITCPWPDAKDFGAVRRRFLFFASHGLVHKGLDLVLEAFTRMPDLHLTVCGPLDSEPAFVDAYRTELYHTPNIETVGWIDTTSVRLRELADASVAMILPTCSEGASTSTIEGMHAGVIPMVTYECGVDVGDFGVLFKQGTIDEIVAQAAQLSSLSSSELRQRARAAWECARARHTRERFVVEYRRTIETIVASFRNGGRAGQDSYRDARQPT